MQLSAELKHSISLLDIKLDNQGIQMKNRIPSAILKFQAKIYFSPELKKCTYMLHSHAELHNYQAGKQTPSTFAESKI